MRPTPSSSALDVATTIACSELPVVHLACSRGGHLDVLLRHQEAFEGCRLVWVTQSSARAERLSSEGAEVHVLGEWHGTALRAETVRSIWRSFELVVRQRPRVVVTSGTGIVVPFCLMARVVGAKLVFVETAARVRSPSRSGRVLSRIARHVIAQWDDMQAIYRGATIVRTSIVEELATDVDVEGVGTFVAVGTHSQPFDRLLEMVDRAAEAGILPVPITAQVGPSLRRMRHADTRNLMTPQEIEETIRNTRHVVCHAGAGTISTSLRVGRRPLVLARLECRGEHFDDHQQEIVDKLATLDLVVPLGDEITASDVARASRPLRLLPDLERLPKLVDCLREHVWEALGEGVPGVSGR